MSAATTARSPRQSPPAAPERTAASAATTAADRADSTAARADSTGATGRVDAEAAGQAERNGRRSGRAGQAATGRKPTRGGRAKAPSSLTVTLAYQDGQWSVAVHQGSKALAKPQPVKPAAALALVGTLDVPGVQKAVEQLVAAERAEAEQRAEQLRAQLAEVEAQLAELQQVG